MKKLNNLKRALIKLEPFKKIVRVLFSKIFQLKLVCKGASKMTLLLGYYRTYKYLDNQSRDFEITEQ